MNLWTSIVTIGSKGFLWLLTWSWQALLLLGMVWIGLKLWRTQLPALRHHIWLAGLSAVTLLPLCAEIAEKLSLPQSNNAALNYVATIPQRPIWTIELQPTMSTPPTSIAATNPSSAPKPNRWSLFFAAMFGLWAIGVMIALIRLLRNTLAVRQMRLSASRVSSAELGCDEISAELALSDHATSPVVVGVWHPQILLPADIANWTTTDERRAMIQHELAHLIRRDPMTNLFSQLVEALLFFHPSIRLVCRQLRIECELACDDLVIASGVKSDLYADSILKAAERLVFQPGILANAPSGAHQLAFYSTRKTLERRIEMILNPDRLRVVTRQWRYLLLPIALIGAASFVLAPARSAHSSIRSGNDEQALIEMVQRVLDGIPERKYGDANLGVSDFINNAGVTLTLMLAEMKGHDFEIGKVVADDFEIIPHEGWVTVTFNAVIRAQNLSTGKDAREFPIRYAVRLKNENGQWRVDRSSDWLELTQKFKPAPPPPPPPPQKGALPPPPPPPPPPFAGQLPNKEYNFQVIGKEVSPNYGLRVEDKQKVVRDARIVVSAGDFEGRPGVRFRMRYFDLRTANVAQVKGTFYLLDRFEIDRAGQTLYGAGILRITNDGRSIEYSLSSDGGIYLSPERTGQPVDFKTLLWQSAQ